MEMIEVDGDELASMTAEILMGVTKQESRFCKDNDPEASEWWDKLVVDIDAIRREHPDAQIDIPSSWGSRD